MKLSSKARYGLKAMIELARAENKLTSLNVIAEQSGVSEAYLEQLFALLKRGGLIDSVRGASGGYYLTKAPEDISCGEIVRALEDDLEFVQCLSGDCSAKDNCSTHKVWQTLYDAINDALDGISLSSLVSDYSQERCC